MQSDRPRHLHAHDANNGDDELPGSPFDSLSYHGFLMGEGDDDRTCGFKGDDALNMGPGDEHIDDDDGNSSGDAHIETSGDRCSYDYGYIDDCEYSTPDLEDWVCPNSPF